MSLILDGTNGVSDIDGSASTPAIRGTDANTGIFFPAADTIAFAEGGVEAMRIDSDGDVGIGTSSPSARLHIADTSGGASGRIRMSCVVSAGYDSRIFQDDTGLNFSAVSDSRSLVFRTGNSDVERARITGGGYFKASNSGTYLGATGTYHEFFNNANSQALIVSNSSTSLTADAILRVDSSRNTTDNTYYAFTYYHGGTGTYKFRIADSGNATNTNGSYGTISDLKLKQDITDATPQWDDIKNLRFRKYRLKSEVELDPNAKPFLGLVAQEAELVCPGLVEEHIDRDKEDNDLGTTTKSIKTSILYMKAVKALQEAMERIETLEAQNAAFEARLAALEGV